MKYLKFKEKKRKKEIPSLSQFGPSKNILKFYSSVEEDPVFSAWFSGQCQEAALDMAACAAVVLLALCLSTLGAGRCLSWDTTSGQIMAASISQD